MDYNRTYGRGMCRGVSSGCQPSGQFPCGAPNTSVYARPGMQNRAMYGRPAAPDMPNCSRNPANDRMNSPSSGCGCTSVSAPVSCDCGDDNRHMQHMPVGMGYVPMQSWEEMYDPATALCQGCAFPSLNLIFCGKRG